MVHMRQHTDIPDVGSVFLELNHLIQTTEHHGLFLPVNQDSKRVTIGTCAEERGCLSRRALLTRLLGSLQPSTRRTFPEGTHPTGPRPPGARQQLPRSPLSFVEFARRTGWGAAVHHAHRGDTSDRSRTSEPSVHVCRCVATDRSGRRRGARRRGPLPPPSAVALRAPHSPGRARSREGKQPAHCRPEIPSQVWGHLLTPHAGR